MGSERLIFAIDRLDRAISHVETAAGRHGQNMAVEAEMKALTNRHERLRDEVEAVIGRLDTLIATAEG